MACRLLLVNRAREIVPFALRVGMCNPVLSDNINFGNGEVVGSCVVGICIAGGDENSCMPRNHDLLFLFRSTLQNGGCVIIHVFNQDRKTA